MSYYKNQNNELYFLDDDCFYNVLPSGCVKISEEEAKEILDSLNKPPSVEHLLENCKADARQRLQDTDWSQLPDAAENLVNKQEFDAYRIDVRNLYINPVTNPTFPNVPKAIWKQT